MLVLMQQTLALKNLAEAIRLAHILDVSVYVTVNILIGDSELTALEAYLKDLERIGVDAIIVQDLAVAKLAQRVAPKLALAWQYANDGCYIRCCSFL